MKKLTLRLDAYGEDARRYVAAAQQLADERKHAEVEPIHLWYVLVDESSLAQAALETSGVDPTTVLVESEWALRQLPNPELSEPSHLSSGFLELLSRAELEATRHGGMPVQTPDLLLACAQEPDGSVRSVMRQTGLNSAIIRESLAEAAGPRRVDRDPPAAATGVLEQYGRDLTR
ncbi:MAG: Clp protease N-terminal domain-containing protein, partial [Myxococcales bacterium]